LASSAGRAQILAFSRTCTAKSDPTCALTAIPVRRQLVAVVTLGNCPNTDILVSDAKATGFCHIQVKTFRPTDRTVSVGRKAEIDPGPRFIEVLAGIPEPDAAEQECVSSIVSAADMAKGGRETHELWARTPGKMACAAMPRPRCGRSTFRFVRKTPDGASSATGIDGI